MHDLDERFTRRRRLEGPDVAELDVEAIAPEARAAAQIVWARRVTNETGSCEVARRLEATAAALALGDSVAAALARLREDEELHASLSRQMLAVLGWSDFVAGEVLSPLPAESPERSFARQVIAALCIAESVSAARYAAVREATDLEVPHACIDVFLRDEVMHGRLGFDLLPLAIGRLEASEGAAAARSFAEAIMRETFVAFDLGVGQDLERRGMPEARPQPAGNPGVVEPTIDALAFYDALHRTIVPSFEAAGLAARHVWATRHGAD